MTSRYKGTGDSSRWSPSLFAEKIDGLEKRIMDRFDRADEDRRSTQKTIDDNKKDLEDKIDQKVNASDKKTSDRVDSIEKRLWYLVAGVGGTAILELLHLIVKKS